MLDLPCPHCGEPWDNDELHGSEYCDYQRAFVLFKVYGCGAFDHIYEGQRARTCDNTPIYTAERITNIRAGWAEAQYAEDMASWMDMLEAVEGGFEF